MTEIKISDDLMAEVKEIPVGQPFFILLRGKAATVEGAKDVMDTMSSLPVFDYGKVILLAGNITLDILSDSDLDRMGLQRKPVN